ncbi:hypothetical protein SAMN05443270_3457 [Lacrimispora sphenoides]|uniref:hypothetical protein n=1 Tax=Lacrimispora sphenoides TaxID=29370 RepID=UPI0008CA3C9B|nr:hypothetical protein [Lacrimispora sphenoides]SEU22231.1 hypothetical protein SAMN05443270_3457 [Lacrimispora sphenoides]
MEAVKKNDTQLTPSQKTANDMVNVRDIKDIFLYTKNGYAICYLNIGNLNIDLMSDDELENVTQRQAMSFEGDKNNFDYFTLPSQVNLDPTKEYLKFKHQETEDLGKRKGLNLMLREVAYLSTSGENFEHQHYIKIWKKIGSNLKDTQKELTIRINEFLDRYMAAGNTCEILKETEIIKMCQLFGNPQQAPYMGIGSINFYETFTQIRG